MSGNSETRVLIVVFDALRPEFVTPELMPALYAFAARGVRYRHARAAFPTETRVNQTTVTTGCLPARHGVVANRFPVPGSRGVVDTGKDEAFEKALAHMEGRLIEVPTLGEVLAAAGRRLATISAGTSGGGRLINLHAGETGGFRLALRRPEVAVPADVFERITARLGSPPRQEVPGVAWNTYAVACWLDWVEPQLRPDVSLLWLSEPDESFHWHGIGSPASLEAIRGVDRAFGHLLERKKAEIEAGALQIIAMSDHGQATLVGPKLDIVERMRAAGFRAGSSPGDGVDYLVAVHNAGGIWVRDGAPELIAPMVDWLAGQPWCGPLFTAEGLPGTLPRSEIGVEHPRAADIILTLASREEPNRWGHMGLTADDSPYPTDGGCHGGLTPFELANFLALSGTAFRQGYEVVRPAGNADIMPTVCALLDVPAPASVDGRVLLEAWADHPGILREDVLTRIVVSDDSKGVTTRLARVEYLRYRYLDAAWRAGPHP